MPLGNVVGPYDQPGGMYAVGNALESGALKNAAQATSNQFQGPILQNQLTAGKLANQKSEAQLPYVGPQAAADLSQVQLANAKAKAILPYAAPEAQAALSAQILSNQHQQFVNQNPLVSLGGVAGNIGVQNYLQNQGNTAGAAQIDAYNKAQIAAQQSLANYRNMGGGYGMGTDAKNLLQLQKQIMVDHPELDQNQANQWASAYLAGNTQLADGTPVPPASGLAQAYINKALKNQTTAGLLTKNIQAKQAEAEIQVMNKYANEGTQLAGTTYAGYSPDQLIDAFGSDPESQQKLGKIIGSQAIQYEIAQLRNRMAGGQPGVTATQELMQQSGQLISSRYPRLTPQARIAASNFINQALQEGLDARLKLGISAGSGNVAAGHGLTPDPSKAGADPLGIR